MFCPNLTFRPRMSVLNEAQVEQIHQATLELLERTGIQVTQPRALELLDGAGAHVDGDRVRIPAWIVEDAIRQAPSRVVLGNRPAYALARPSDDERQIDLRPTDQKSHRGRLSKSPATDGNRQAVDTAPLPCCVNCRERHLAV